MSFGSELKLYGELILLIWFLCYNEQVDSHIQQLDQQMKKFNEDLQRGMYILSLELFSSTLLIWVILGQELSIVLIHRTVFFFFLIGVILTLV